MQKYIEELERQTDELFESFLGNRPRWNLEASSLEPLCNVSIKPNVVVATADLPYTKPETVKVDIKNDSLIEVTAEMKNKMGFSDFGIAHRDGEFNSLRCHIHIPVPVDLENMSILLKRGILEIRLPRKERYKIEIE
jgi:HSP20 family molecular chaperone IbpA